MIIVLLCVAASSSFHTKLCTVRNGMLCYDVKMLFNMLFIFLSYNVQIT